MIVFAKPPKRSKPARPATVAKPLATVVVAKKAKRWQMPVRPMVDDPEADARVKAFIRRVLRLG